MINTQLLIFLLLIMVNNNDDRKRKREDDSDEMNKILRIVQPIASRYMTQFSAISNGVPSFPSTIYSYVSPSNLYHYSRNDPFQDVLNSSLVFLPFELRINLPFPVPFQILI